MLAIKGNPPENFIFSTQLSRCSFVSKKDDTNREEGGNTFAGKS